MLYFFAILLPPVAVLFCGKPVLAVLNVPLTLLGWIPGVVHALFVVHSHEADLRAQGIQRAIYSAATASMPRPYRD